MSICNELKQLIVNYLNGEINSVDYINDLKTTLPKFEKEFDLYIRTDWSRIKVETVGKRMNGGIKFWENDYKQYLEYYNDKKIVEFSRLNKIIIKCVYKYL